MPQLNNQGGGIFRFLPIATHDDIYSPYFDTPHQHDFSHFCAGFSLPYTLASTRAGFEQAFELARRAGGPHIIEVPTDKDEGYALVGALREAAKAAARKAVANC